MKVINSHCLDFKDEILLLIISNEICFIFIFFTVLLHFKTMQNNTPPKKWRLTSKEYLNLYPQILKSLSHMNCIFLIVLQKLNSSCQSNFIVRLHFPHLIFIQCYKICLPWIFIDLIALIYLNFLGEQFSVLIFPNFSFYFIFVTFFKNKYYFI